MNHALPDLGLPWPDLALRWAAHQPGVASVLVGSQRLENLAAAVATVSQGPLPTDALAALEAAWARAGRDWPGLV